MKQIISEKDFINGFKEAGRENQFSLKGLKALFNYLEEWERDVGHEIEFDVIAICCDFTEFENIEQFIDEHGNFSSIKEENYDDGEYKGAVLEKLEQYTQVIMIDEDAFIMKNY